jgi:hypothetical protein
MTICMIDRSALPSEPKQQWRGCGIWEAVAGPEMNWAGNRWGRKRLRRPRVFFETETMQADRSAISHSLARLTALTRPHTRLAGPRTRTHTPPPHQSWRYVRFAMVCNGKCACARSLLPTFRLAFRSLSPNPSHEPASSHCHCEAPAALGDRACGVSRFISHKDRFCCVFSFVQVCFCVFDFLSLWLGRPPPLCCPFSSHAFSMHLRIASRCVLFSLCSNCCLWMNRLGLFLCSDRKSYFCIPPLVVALSVCFGLCSRCPHMHFAFVPNPHTHIYISTRTHAHTHALTHTLTRAGCKERRAHRVPHLSARQVDASAGQSERSVQGGRQRRH